MDRNQMIGLIKEDYPEAQENQAWTIEDDKAADWWIDINKEEIKQIEYLEDQLKEKMEYYNQKLKKIQEKKQNRIDIMTGKLAKYLETKADPEKIKSTKTQDKYELPTGAIIKKYPAPKIVRNEEKLLEWVKTRPELHDLIEVQAKVAWGELKKQTEQTGDFIVMKDTGELVDGIELEARPPTIEIK